MYQRFIKINLKYKVSNGHISDFVIIENIMTFY